MLKNVVLEVAGRNWKVREAVSEEKALEAITSARVSGSIGAKLIRDRTYVGGTRFTEADVVQINSDGTERRPYTEAY